MPKSTPILLAVIVLLIASLACSLQNEVLPPTPDLNVIDTAIAQTVSAELTQVAPTLTPIILASNTPWPTFTPSLIPSSTVTSSPVFTPTLTVTPSPVFTPTPVVPLISVSVSTNCRSGPGKVYNLMGALLVGEFAQVYGRDPYGGYWYIPNPDNASEFCWVWGEYATLSGNVSALPIYTPPPTPTPMPNFDAYYHGKDSCDGWWVDLNLQNTGGSTFASIALSLKDTVSGTYVTLYANRFIDRDGCYDSITAETLVPGTNRTISSPPFSYDPTGRPLEATITLCSNTSQSGTCVTRIITFVP